MDDDRQITNPQYSLLRDVNCQTQRGSSMYRSSGGGGGGGPWRRTRKSLVRWDCEDLWGQKQWSTSKRVILGRRTLGVLSQPLDLIELNEYELNYVN